jgi:hypothetical protein
VCSSDATSFRSALGRTRTCDLLIRSHSPSGTRADTEGQGETKQRFYQVVALLEGQGGTGKDTGCGQIAVKTWVLQSTPTRDAGTDSYVAWQTGLLQLNIALGVAPRV